MKKIALITHRMQWLWLLGLSALSWTLSAAANPVGGTVTQGNATFSSQGSQFTINQTSGRAYINVALTPVSASSAAGLDFWARGSATLTTVPRAPALAV